MITQPSALARTQRKTIAAIIFVVLLQLMIVSASTEFTINFITSSFQSYRINGSNMEPGMHNGQLILASTLPYVFGKPQRGDIIILLRPPLVNPACGTKAQLNAPIIGRIIGIPGDTIAITWTAVILNGKALKEPYIAFIPTGFNETYTTVSPITLRQGDYYVLGDNRLDSVDSRCFGPVPIQKIVGKVLTS